MITLENVDGNAFSIMAFVRQHMRRAGFTAAEQQAYVEAATSADYTNLLFVSQLQVDAINARTGADVVSPYEGERP